MSGCPRRWLVEAHCVVRDVLAFASRYSISAWRFGSSIGSVKRTVWLRSGVVAEMVY
jgi:hypothetical protein